MTAVGIVVLTHDTGSECLPLVDTLLDDGFNPADIAIVQNRRPDKLRILT